MKKLIIFALPIGIVLAIAASAYVYLNLRQDANTQVIDQSSLDDTKILESLESTTPSQTSPDNLIDFKTQADNPIQDHPTALKSGNFTRFDPAHFANGQAVIYQTEEGPVLKLENFSTNNGPDLFVYLSTNPDITGIKTDRGDSVSLGKLKQIEGDQVYLLPEDYDQYGSVIIWCRAFDINFSAASLESI